MYTIDNKTTIEQITNEVPSIKRINVKCDLTPEFADALADVIRGSSLLKEITTSWHHVNLFTFDCILDAISSSQSIKYLTMSNSYEYFNADKIFAMLEKNKSIRYIEMGNCQYQGGWREDTMKPFLEKFMKSIENRPVPIGITVDDTAIGCRGDISWLQSRAKDTPFCEIEVWGDVFKSKSMAGLRLTLMENAKNWNWKNQN